MVALSSILKTRREGGGGSIEDWTDVNVTGNLKSVAYGATTWVAVGSNNKILYNSGTPTSAWSDANPNLDGNYEITDVVYLNGYFVASTRYPVRIITSPDGINWTINASVSSNYHTMGLAIDGNKVVLAVSVRDDIGATLTSWYTSTPEGAWSSSVASVYPKLGGPAKRLSWADGYWYLRFETSTISGYEGAIYWSANGISWNEDIDNGRYTPINPDSTVVSLDGKALIAGGNYITKGNSPMGWYQKLTIYKSEIIHTRCLKLGNDRLIIAEGDLGLGGLFYYEGMPYTGDTYFKKIDSISTALYWVHYNEDYWVAVGDNKIFVAGPGL